jgi:PiT family inorganic phosphate transporter
VSETHGLVGGLIGAAIVTAGAGIVEWQRVVSVLASIVVSPVFGFAGGAILILAVYWAFHRSDRRVVKPWFVHLQRASAAYMAFSHGRNDAQKPMGVLAMAFAVQYELKELHVAPWIVVSCSAAAALGTWYGGWRIIKTLGSKLTDLNPVQGFAAEVSGATVLHLASEAGVPVSTTHAITSSIIGVGAVRRRSSVRWTVLLEIFASWIVTLPATILLGGAIMYALRALTGGR